MSKSKTKAEQQHLADVAAMGCIVCRHEGFGESPAEIHHIRDGVGKGQLASNFEVLLLCPLHHRLGGWGVAFHAGSKCWQERYGSERSGHF